MAMGTRKQRERQEELWYEAELPTAPGHPFYNRLNEVLDKAGFDHFCETNCAGFYHAKLGRPSLAPGLYFRVMMIGFFEGLDSERGIAWRLADSLTLRQFLSVGLDEKTPDHVTISRTRRLINAETHQRVFNWVLDRLAQDGLLKGKTIGVDSTTLEANAAMKSIVRRDTGESYNEYLKRLAETEGLDAKDAAALRRMDRKRKKKTSNEDWESPSDGEAEITKLKDGRTALAYKAENAVDMETGAIVAVTTHGGACADTATVEETVIEAGLTVAELLKRNRRKATMRCIPVEWKKWWLTRDTTATRLRSGWEKWGCGLTSQNRIGERATGMASRRKKKPCMATGGASGESGASGCSGSGEKKSNGTSRISSIRGAWTGSTSGASGTCTRSC